MRTEAEIKTAIKGMGLAGNHGWAILALLELMDIKEAATIEKTLQRVELGLKGGRIREAVREAVE